MLQRSDTARLSAHSTGHQRLATAPPYLGLALIKNLDNRSLEAPECSKPDGRVVSWSDRKAVIAFLILSEDELDLRAQRWISADTWELSMMARPDISDGGRPGTGIHPFAVDAVDAQRLRSPYLRCHPPSLRREAAACEPVGIPHALDGEAIVGGRWQAHASG